MDYELLESFHPRLHGIYDRDRGFWTNRGMELVRNRTEVNTLALVYDGAGMLEINGQVTPLSQGMLFYFPVGARLRIIPGDSGRLNFYSVLFHHLQFQWEGDKADKVGIEAVQSLPIPHTLSCNESHRLLDSYRRMLGMWQRREDGYRWKCKLEFQQLLELIMRMNDKPSSPVQGSAAIVIKAIEMIRNTLHEPFDRSALAKQLSITPSHFSVIFKQHTGTTPVEFVTRQRMEQAKQLLRSTQMKIGDISEAVGYRDSFYFSRLFSKETGMSPSAFRNA